MNQKKRFPYISCRLITKLLNWRRMVLRNLIASTILPRTCSRATTIIPEMVGQTLLLHNGKKLFPLFIKEAFVGHKLGEFIFTRKFKKHKKQGPKKIQKSQIIEEDYD